MPKIDYEQRESRTKAHLQSFFFIIDEFGQLPHKILPVSAS
jgi:hypothetical protein